MLEHLIPGEAFITFNDEDVYGNANKHEIVFKKLDKVNESMWTLNGFKIMRTAALTDKLSLIFIDGMLGDRKAGFAKRNIQETNRYNEPQKLEMKNVTKDEQAQSLRKDVRQNALLTFLAGMKSGTKVFQHFLTKSNLTQVLDGKRLLLTGKRKRSVIFIFVRYNLYLYVFADRQPIYGVNTVR